MRSIWERLSARRKVTLKTSVNLYWMGTKWTWSNNWGKKMGRDYWLFYFVFVPGKIDFVRSLCVWAQSGEGRHKGISVGHSGIAFLRCSFLEWISYSVGIFIVANSIRFLWIDQAYILKHLMFEGRGRKAGARWDLIIFIIWTKRSFSWSRSHILSGEGKTGELGQCKSIEGMDQT